nr:hypothetical protein [Candidatus Sigynarchaeum springense]
MITEDVATDCHAERPSLLREEAVRKAVLAHAAGILVMYLAAYLLTPMYPGYALPWFVMWISWPFVFLKQKTSKGVFALGGPSAIMPHLGVLLLEAVGTSWFLCTYTLSIAVIPWLIFYALRYTIRPWRRQRVSDH